MSTSEVLDFLNKNSGALTVLFTAVVTISTVVYSILTGKLVSETTKMRQVQTEPKIEITIKPFDFAINIVRLHVRNIGLGPAINVRFNLKTISGGQIAQTLIDEFAEANFLKIGLKYFGPGQELYSHYTQLTQQYNEKIESILVIEISYQSATGVKYIEQSIIDMSELKGAYQLGTPNLYSIAKSLEKIQKDISQITSGHKKISAQVYTTEDRQKEKEDLKAFIEKNQNRPKT
ncbi:MAG: hypothetical protein E6127_11420 [Enterobacter sichuanensis]|jgi:hypothetical protein|uniref:hypothetical protein n=1 Tax=Enterobacter sichuanensis TaxID=2071710 RepID=UPI001C287BF9|nr:hypothetical protein [Enterobacter sichuanensis]MDU5194540.1 hypothetical protein [Enterobacter sichuanensis]MDU5347375.1 hypothetical protein [Enterobacter sichuanensis]MDU5386707.1 hypothetical protein [Enterobacter sichuanensis]HBG9397786.1 hypothetical protein [Citrobacter freundii]